MYAVVAVVFGKVVVPFHHDKFIMHKIYTFLHKISISFRRIIKTALNSIISNTIMLHFDS